MGSWAGTFARAMRRSAGGVVGVVGGERPVGGATGGAAAGGLASGGERARRRNQQMQLGLEIKLLVTHWLISTPLATSQLAT